MNRPVRTTTLAVWIACSLLSATLAACSGSGGGDAKPTGTTPADTKNDDKKDDAKGTAALAGRTIRIAGNADYAPKPDNPLGVKAISLQKEVEKKYNVKIEYVAVPQAEYMDKLKASILNGSPIADIVFMGSPGAVPALTEQGLVLPIDNLLVMSREKEIPVEAFSKLTGYKGKTYGFGTNSSVDQIGIFYNRAMFRTNGLPDPHEWVKKKEWTWDKFREVARQLTKDTNGDGKPDQWGLTGYAGDWLWFNILANGGSIVDIEAGKQKLDDPKSIAAMDFMAKLFTEDKVVADPTWAFLDLFAKGNIGMTPSFSWTGSTWKEKMKQYGYGFLPMPLAPGQTDYANPARQVNCYFLPKGVKDPAAVLQVWKELQVWDSKEWVETYYNTQYDNEDDIEVARMLAGKVRYDFFAGIHGGIIDKIGTELATGKTTAAQAAKTYGPQLQDKIDTILKQ
ncbi:ABC transporter substrate-binding protein [Paenibacillus hodogayensis]|uniref:ABC transporter substrate-binding protein n=1 Tax=Paenibacillus hodogayensis TaxID=279208 RepID=A0ABV5VY40_9BACL